MPINAVEGNESDFGPSASRCGNSEWRVFNRLGGTLIIQNDAKERLVEDVA